MGGRSHIISTPIAVPGRLRSEALAHARQYGRHLDLEKTDSFVGMYVNDWTLDFGPRGREAVAVLLRRGFEEGIIPRPVELEFVG